MNSLAPFEPATPAMIVGRALGGAAPLPLGLDEPFALLGGDRLGPGGIRDFIMHDHQPELRQWVLRTCETLTADGALFFKMQPLVISGPKGAGRTHAARWLAYTAGLPHAILNLTDPVIAANIAASREVDEALWALPPTIAMAAARCANPVVTVLGADRASDDVVAGLAAMIDPATATSWCEDRLKTEIDLGEVNWVIQCDQPGSVPAAIREHASFVRLVTPPYSVNSTLALTVLLEAMHDLGTSPQHPAMSWRAVRRRVSDYRPFGTKALYALMSHAITDILRGDADDFEPDDVPF